MKFGGLQKTSLIDFPDRISTVLFVIGCNLRCPFCYNWRLVLEPKGPFLSEETVFEILESRKKNIDAVVVTGGEPCTQSDLPQFLKKLKEKGFAIKLDTNGFFPKMLEECLSYLDYIAVDVKTSPERYSLLGVEDVSGFLRTVAKVKGGKVDYEFRSTMVPSFIDNQSVQEIGEIVKGAKRYAFQQFVPGDTLDKSFNTVKPYTVSVIDGFVRIMKNYVDEVILRV